MLTGYTIFAIVCVWPASACCLGLGLEDLDFPLVYLIGQQGLDSRTAEEIPFVKFVKFNIQALRINRAFQVVP